MLTLAQSRTLEFIRKFYKTHDYAPTAREIAQGIGISSRGVVYRYLKALKEAGYIDLLTGRHRNIVLRDDSSQLNSFEIPLMGVIAAGQPIEGVENQQTICVSDIFQKADFALRVRGDSMVDEGILDNDIVMCKRASSADNGDIVVALIDNENVTLKRILYHDNGQVKLIPANKYIEPLVLAQHRVTIQGIFMGLIRL